MWGRMARPLRIEFEGAIYHLCARGNARQLICHDVPALTKALNNLQQAGHLGDLHTFDGAFAARNTRGSGQISAHAYGVAVDINAATAPRGSRALQPLNLRTSFMRAGFVDGGTWVRPWAVRDPMHFTVGF